MLHLFPANRKRKFYRTLITPSFLRLWARKRESPNTLASALMKVKITYPFVAGARFTVGIAGNRAGLTKL